MQRRLLAIALLFGAAGAIGAEYDVHPDPGMALRPLPERPDWMRRSTAANLPEVESRRAQLVIAYCGQCHVPPPPQMRTPAEWRSMIVRMDAQLMAQQRLGLRPARNDELIEIARYYERHAQQSPMP